MTDPEPPDADVLALPDGRRRRAQDLPESARAAPALAAEDARTPAVPAGSLPFPLSGLPWDRPVKPVVRDLEPPATRDVVWLDGERAEWAAEGEGVRVPSGPAWAADPLSMRGTGQEPGLLLYGPDDLVRPLLADWKAPALHEDAAWVRAVVARFGTDAYPVARQLAKGVHPGRAELILPFRDAEVALLVGEWLLPGKRGADVAADWCDRHGLAAVPFVVPAVLGTAAGRRRAAEAVLRRVADRHGPDAVAAASTHPREIGEILAAHPTRTGLVHRPKPDVWADPAALPRVLLRDRERTLPPEAMRTLVELLALQDDEGGRVIADVCDPESLAGFGLALFRKWQEAETPKEDEWALMQLARTGNDAALPLLLPLIKVWPGRDRMRSVERGLEVLTAIGSDAALTAVQELAVQWKGMLLRKAAGKAFERAAARRGMSAGRLGDLLVPDIELDAEAAVAVDYGRRRFTVRFDGGLRPLVTGDDGRVRKSLPKPGKQDDPEIAPAAHAAFTELKKRVDAIASLQTLRLRDAMLTGHRWTPAEFRDHAIAHPVLRLLARRLVWLAHEGDGEGDGGEATAFRVAEDGTFADVADAAFVPSESARIGVAHPALLGGDLATWVEAFADYEILQPFQQLGRPAVALTGAERAGGTLDRFAGRTVPRDAVDRLLHGAWSRNRYEDPVKWIARFTGRDRCVVVEMEPGGDPDHLIVQGVRAATTGRERPPRTVVPARFADLDPVGVSEALVDVTALTEGPP